MKVFCILPEVSNKYPRCSVSVTWIQRWNSELLRPNPKRLCFVHETDCAKSSHHPPPSPNNAINVLILLKIYRIGSLHFCLLISTQYLQYPRHTVYRPQHKIPSSNYILMPQKMLSFIFHWPCIEISCRKKIMKYTICSGTCLTRKIYHSFMK